MLQVESELKKKEVRFLTDAAAEFVSLVRHGANQTPFRVIKQEKEGGEEMGLMVIQSLLMPKGQGLEVLTGKEELAWLSDAKTTDVQKFETYDKYEQMPLGEFDDKSLRMVKLHDSGSWAIAGKLNDEGKATKALTLGEAEIKKIESIVANPVFGAEVEVAAPVPGIVRQFGDVFDSELRNFMDVVHGALSQSGAAPVARKKTVMNAIDAFKSFMVMALDSIGKEDVSVDVNAIDLKSTKKEAGGEDMFKTKEEFTSAVMEILDGRDTAAKEAAEKEAKEAAALKKENVDTEKKEEKTEKKETPAVKTDEAPAWAKELVEKVDSVVKKQEVLENQLSTSSGSSDDDPVVKEEKEDVTDKKFDAILQNKSPFGGVFDGLLTRKREAA